MKKIRLIQVGEEVTSALNYVAQNLERVQTEYLFELSSKTIKFKEPAPEKGYHDSYLWKVIKQYMVRNDYDLSEYPIAITNAKLIDEDITINDNSCAVISTYSHKEHSKQAIEDYIMYAIASILPDVENQITQIHDETRGCPNDLCENFYDMDLGIKKGEYCTSCKKQLFEADEKGLISVQKLASIFRILNFIAARKICFVIMPFDKKFDYTYTVIKKTVEELGYECRRADEVYEARNIMDIVNERIICADLVIADLTNACPNVFYELGYAHANGKKTILMTQDINSIPFDLRQKQHFVYNNNNDQTEIIQYKLIKYLE